MQKISASKYHTSGSQVDPLVTFPRLSRSVGLAEPFIMMANLGVDAVTRKLQQNKRLKKTTTKFIVPLTVHLDS